MKLVSSNVVSGNDGEWGTLRRLASDSIGSSKHSNVISIGAFEAGLMLVGRCKPARLLRFIAIVLYAICNVACNNCWT